jgi:4'-phosphopantetheinyl transferase
VVARATRLRSARDRDRYLTAHTALRLTVGAHLGVPPEDLRFTTGSHGKPALAFARPVPEVHFNLSHSEGLAALVVSAAGAVGVDVERIRPGFDYAPVVELLFDAEERAGLDLPDAGARAEAFFRAWTRKEALVKAVGSGLGAEAGTPADADPHGKGWSVRSFRPAPGYVGAVAAPGLRWSVATRWWSFNVPPVEVPEPAS